MSEKVNALGLFLLFVNFLYPTSSHPAKKGLLISCRGHRTEFSNMWDTSDMLEAFPTISRTSSSACFQQAQEIAVLPLEILEQVKLFYSQDKAKASPHYDACVFLYPNSINVLIQVLALITSNMHPRLQIWHPYTVIQWPDKIPASTNSSWKKDIRNILQNKISRVLQSSVDVTQYVYFGFEVENTFASAETNDTEFFESFWEVYFINGFDESVPVIEEVVDFQQNMLDSLHPSPEMSQSQRGNLRQAKLTTVAPNNQETKTELTWVKDADGNSTLVGGISVEMLKDFENVLNFTTNIIEGDWISAHSNGTLKGKTAQLLLSRQVDLMIGQTVPIIIRASALDYLQPTSKNTLRAFFQQPPASSIRDIFISPFHFPLWLALLIVWCLIVVSLRLITFLLTKSGSLPKDDDLLDQECFIWAVGTVAQQGWHKQPRSSPLRGIFITGSLLGLICYIAYAAEIVSSLSSEKVPIQSLSDLLRSSVTIYASRDSSTVAQVLKNVEVDLKIQYVSPSVGVYLTFNAPNSFIVYSHIFHHERQLQNISDDDSCKLVQSFPVTRTPLPSAMSVPKGSPLRELFNHVIMGMKERGFLARYNERFNTASGLTCLRRSTRYRAQLGLEDISTSVAILLLGYLLCLSMLVTERVKMYVWRYFEN